jgi:hypothetical protein
MKANSSFKYFRRTLTLALNYFCQEQKQDNLNEVNNENDKNISIKALSAVINKSYKLFIERFPKQILRFKKLKQENIIEYYKQTFDTIENPLPKPILQLNESNTLRLLQENDDQDNIQHDSQSLSNRINSDDHEEEDEEEEEDDQSEDNQIVKQNQLQSIKKEETFDNQSHQKTLEEKSILLEILSKDLNDNQKDILYKQYNEQGSTIFIPSNNYLLSFLAN